MNQPNTPPHSPAVQDYLRAIYQLTGTSGAGARATTSELAARLAVRPASVTAMLQKMAAADPALVDYHKSHGARLTSDGERAALSVVRCHRLLELFLHRKLGFGWDEVHEEADRLEHVISVEMTDRIDQALGYPSHDPHGHAIPDASLALARPDAMPLAELTGGSAAVVECVPDEDPDLLRYLDTIDLRPGSTVKVMRHDAPAAQVWISVCGSEPVELGLDAAWGVYVVRRAT